MKDYNFSETQIVKALDKFENEQVSQILKEVSKALIEKGYNPVNQIVGYVLSGDPTYITASGNARNNITKIERDELLEEFVSFYLKNNI